MNIMYQSLIALFIVGVGIGSFQYGREVGEKHPIESKTPIEPDLVIVISGGELDTTFVYRRQ